ncbi:hypothetical protein [Jannaschia sp. LMIT008]|uniref:hypothetical protein n=1 Tax=Jannaschia maritima TaxID=3032585 RepID=UPI00281208A1|nr:hypothetical protein [Jannaschia sp. LMIT008]
MKAIAVLILSLAFAASPLLVDGFAGFEPSQFPVVVEEPPVQPAGWAFAIWGPIYAWLIVSAAYGVLFRRDDAGWDAARPPLIVSLGVGAVWIPVANASPVWASVLIWAMLGGAVWALLRAPRRDRMWFAWPVGLYAGWLTAASCVSLGILAMGYGLPPFGPVGWSVLFLVVALGIAGAVLWRRAVWTYAAAVAWALVGVVAANGFGIVATLAGFGAVGVASMAVRMFRA